MGDHHPGALGRERQCGVLSGGIRKGRILNVLNPHMIFDDQRSHLESEAGEIPMVHIPFGATNPGNDD